MTKAVLQTRQDLPLLGDATPEIGLCDFEPACSAATALVVAVKCASQFCLQRLDLFADRAYLLFEGFAFGIGNQAVLGFRRSAILNDLVNGIVLGKKLETILLTPTQPQTVDDLGGRAVAARLVSTGICCPSSPTNKIVRMIPTAFKRVFFSNSR